VPDDAVADLAESREMDKQPLLEQRRERGVQIGRLFANFHNSSISPGAASAEQKKLGKTPKRSATSFLKRSVVVCCCVNSSLPERLIHASRGVLKGLYPSVSAGAVLFGTVSVNPCSIYQFGQACGQFCRAPHLLWRQRLARPILGYDSGGARRFS
jgi:hypothetical protein